jgi:hypothetical protein
MTKFYLEIELKNSAYCTEYRQSCPVFDDEASGCNAMNGKRIDYDTDICGHRRPIWCPLLQIVNVQKDTFELWKGQE